MGGPAYNKPSNKLRRQLRKQQEAQSRTVKLQISEKQMAFVQAEQFIFGFISGVGGGKTSAGCYWVLLNRIANHFNSVGLIACPTYGQFSKSVMPALKKVLDQLNIPFVYGAAPPKQWSKPDSSGRVFQTRFISHDNVLTTRTGGQIVCTSMTNYDLIRGADYAWAWVDEAAFEKNGREALDVIVGRMRGYGDGFPYQIRITSSPNGFNWLWEALVGPDKIANSGCMHASTYDNPFLSDAEIQQILSTYSAEQVRQEIYGEWVNLASGRAFDFSRERNVGETAFTPELPLVFAADFNTANMTGLVCQMNKQARWVRVLDEVRIDNNARTRDLCQTFVHRWREVRLPSGQLFRPVVHWWGDRAGRNADTRSDTSDIEIMRDSLRGQFPDVHEASDYVQRPVYDGVQAINALLNPAAGPSRFVIHPRCSNLIRDFEQCSWNGDKRELEKDKDFQLTHAADAIRYPVHQYFPIRSGSLIGGMN